MFWCSNEKYSFVAVRLCLVVVLFSRVRQWQCRVHYGKVKVKCFVVRVKSSLVEQGQGIEQKAISGCMYPTILIGL